MVDVVTDQSALDALLNDTPDVISAVLGSASGELHSVTGSFVDGDSVAASSAALIEALAEIGVLLGFGDLDVASVKATTAARVFARLRDAVVAIELPARTPLGDLEAKLRQLGWGAEEELVEQPVDLLAGLPAGLPARLPAGPPADLPAVAPFEPWFDRPDEPSFEPPVAASFELPFELPFDPPVEPPFEPAPTPPLTGRSVTRPLAPDPLPDPPARLSPASGIPVRQTPPPAPRTGGPGRSTSSVGSGPVFTGDLEEFCLPDLLEFLRNSHRSGLLICTTSTGIGTIQLSRGMVTGADSPNAIDLREYFLTSPEVDPARRSMFATLPVEVFDEDLIEDSLISRALAGPDEIERARIARVYSAFREMIGWTAGRFSFDPAVPIVANPALALSARTILMHIYQEQDEEDW